MSGNHTTADLDLVAAVLTREPSNARPADASDYSWGAVSPILPTRVHARVSAVAVLDGLRGAGRLMTVLRLAEFGRAGWVGGWLIGVLLGVFSERYAWPWWLAVPAAGASFAAGVCAIGWAARRLVGPDGGRRG